MKTISQDLFQLIQSLTKQEKRYFKLYASRHVIGEKNKYVLLFDAIANQAAYDEEKIKKKFKGEVFIKQLHVTKNYLYKLIMNSLRLFNENKSEDQFHNLMRNAQILFDKGLFEQGQKLVNKAKKEAQENEHFLQLLEVYHWEHRMIHKNNDFKKLQRYIDEVVLEEIQLLELYKNFLQFQLLNDQVFGLYWKKGSIRKKEDKELLERFFEKDLYQNADNAQSFNARFFYHNAHFTFAYLTGDLENCYRHISQQVLMFEESDVLQKNSKNIQRYISCLNNSYIIQKQLSKFEEGLATLRKLRAIPATSVARRAQLFIRSYNLEIDLYISTGAFRKGIQNIAVFEENFDTYKGYIETQQRINLYYNLAYLHFGGEDYNHALDWVNVLLNDPDLKAREDIHSFTRILNLFIHFELENDQLLEYIVKSTYRFLLKRKRLYKVESIILKFLRKYSNWTDQKEMQQGFEEMLEDLYPLREEEYEKNAFEYFDFITWLESKLEGVTFEEMVVIKRGAVELS